MRRILPCLLVLFLLISCFPALCEEADGEMTAEVWQSLSETQTLPEEAREYTTRGTVISAIAHGDYLYYLSTDGLYQVDTKTLEESAILTYSDLLNRCSQAFALRKMSLCFRSNTLLLLDWHSGHIWTVTRRNMSHQSSYNTGELNPQACWSPCANTSRMLLLTGGGLGNLGHLVSLDLEVGILMESETNDLAEIALWDNGHIACLVAGAGGTSQVVRANLQGRDREVICNIDGLSCRGLECDRQTKEIFLITDQGLCRILDGEQSVLFHFKPGQHEIDYLLSDHDYTIVSSNRLILLPIRAREEEAASQ